jgi:hypothetical protein
MVGACSSVSADADDLVRIIDPVNELRQFGTLLHEWRDRTEITADTPGAFGQDVDLRTRLGPVDRAPTAELVK